MSTLFRNPSKSFQTLNPHLWPVSDIKRAARGFTERKRGIMNKTERDFSLILAAQLVKGEIIGWMFEAVKLKIGDGCFYTPDFMVIEYAERWTTKNGVDCHPTEIKFIEVKGFLRDDARVKFLAAQEQHKWASFEMWKRDKKQGWTQIL